MNIAKSIYEVARTLDHKLGWGKDYGYETAPYCGHHYSGYKGRLLTEHFHEGDGGGCTRSLLGFRVYRHTAERYEYKIIWTFGKRVRQWYRTVRSITLMIGTSVIFVQYETANHITMLSFNRIRRDFKSRKTCK